MLEVFLAVQVGNAVLICQICSMAEASGCAWLKKTYHYGAVRLVFICLEVFGDPGLSQVSPSSFISFPVLGWLNFGA